LLHPCMEVSGRPGAY